VSYIISKEDKVIDIYHKKTRKISKNIEHEILNVKVRRCWIEQKYYFIYFNRHYT